MKGEKKREEKERKERVTETEKSWGKTWRARTARCHLHKRNLFWKF